MIIFYTVLGIMKIFNLKFDVEWVYKERRRVSDEINEILVGI